jgi:drug/metabolite transporter (DMT)-like permease
MLGGLLALTSAALFGLNNASVRRGVLTGSATQGMAITVPLGVPLFFLSALVVGSLGILTEFSGMALFLLASAGIIHFVWGRYWNYRAIQAMGNNLVGPIQQSSLLISLGGAVWLLDETLTPLRLVGIALILLGPLVMLRSRKKYAKEPKSTAQSAGAAAAPAATTFKPDYLKGSFFAIMSTTGYGSSALFIRGALEGMTPGAAIAGGIVSYFAASVIVGLYLMAPGQWQDARSIDRTAARWFTLSGVFVCFSQMARFMALSIAPVAVVAPLQQTSAIFRVIFGWVINRQHEDFSFWVMAGILVSLSGAFALTLSVEFLIEIFPVPQSLIDIARWQWP